MKPVKPNKKFDKDQLTMHSCSIELYQESESYNSPVVLSNIKEYCEKHDCKYAIMLHDNDFFHEDTFNSNYELIGRKGEKKKNHYHINIWFKNRVYLNDVCLAFGLEDRWIKILKHDYDFENMVLYCTHVKYDPRIKAHYEVSAFDSNIGEYIQYLYDSYIKSLDKSNIVMDAMELLNANENTKLSYQLYISSLVQFGYAMGEIKQYYNMLKDLLIEHNMSVDSSDVIEHSLTASRAESADRTNLKLDEVDITGFATIQRGDDRYLVVKKERTKKKKE